MSYNAMELMICCAARSLEDGRTVAVGTGVPCAAAMLAQRTHAPNLVVLFEAGGVAPQLPTMPISVGDSRTFYRGADGHQHGRRHGDRPARHDRLHLPRRRPDRRLRQPQLDHDRRPRQAEGALPRQRRRQRPGVALLADPGGDAAERQRFVEKLDFLTTPGYLTGPGAREAAGLPPATGRTASSPTWR